MRRTLGLSLAIVLAGAALPALAHPGHDGSGFLHPFSGLDHLLAMLGVGLWAAFLARRRPAAAGLLPASFLVMMLAGAAAGFAGMNLPLAEAAISLSLVALGGLIVAGVRPRASLAMAVVGLFAVFHGYAHALEAPASDTGGYILGFLAATAVLLAAGLGLGRLAQRALGEPALRALGGAVAAVGAVALIAG